MEEKLMNQTQFAVLHGIKRQRAGQLIKSGELMTQKVGARIYVIDNKFNKDVVKDLCGGTGNWNKPRDY
jgi:hypothetical protein